MHVAEFGQDVAGDLGSGPHRFDLISERVELAPLRVGAEVRKLPKTSSRCQSEPLSRAVHIGGPAAPFLAGLEPPRFVVLEFAQVGEPPCPEFGHHQRLVTGAPSIAMRAEREVGPPGEVVEKRPTAVASPA